MLWFAGSCSDWILVDSDEPTGRSYETGLDQEDYAARLRVQVSLVFDV